jgi:dipeptidyl aminopeptidase/acylaminoacyl peptidase
LERIEALLSARSFLAPQLVKDRIFFISNLSGHMSLYAMNFGGSVPEPLLPPDLTLQNPHLMEGYPFYTFPNLEKILVLIDADGNEVYKPMLIPMDGGFPVPVYEDRFADFRIHLLDCDAIENIVYFSAESQLEPVNESFQANLKTGEIKSIAKSKWGAYVAGASSDHRKVVLIDAYTAGDHAGFLWDKSSPELRLIFGTPIENRKDNLNYPINSITETHFTPQGGLVFTTSLFDDRYGLGYLPAGNKGKIEKIKIIGTIHSGFGELEEIRHTVDNHYAIKFNIDGCSWLYEGTFDEDQLIMQMDDVLCGRNIFSAGVIEEFYYDKLSDRFIFSFSTATSPSQLFTISGVERNEIVQHTNERILGLIPDNLSPGEDASFTSFDGTRVSARLYLPSKGMDYKPPYPLVYYIHGGPQDQERPDFSWFSIPLIQLLTLKGCAVFVPNVRGSTGYGLFYMKEVDRDWGGKDRLDHVYAMQEILSKDERLDISRSGVVGRSYGGYMTLTLAGRHPELWSAAVDMFGPYDLLTFSDRIPETWKPYFSIALGDPVKDKDFLIERSPKTYLTNLSFPMLVIQGKNDPRVVEQESRELVNQLISEGKEIKYLMFENEGHDVLKYENRVTCYNAIVEFFLTHLTPSA